MSFADKEDDEKPKDFDDVIKNVEPGMDFPFGKKRELPRTPLHPTDNRFVIKFQFYFKSSQNI